MAGIINVVTSVKGNANSAQHPVLNNDAGKIIGLIGQSNQSSRAIISEIPSEYSYLNSTVTTTKIYNYSLNVLQNLIPGSTLQGDQSVAEFGFELPIGHHINSSNNFILKKAHGGSITANVAGTVKGSWNVNIANEYYANYKLRYTALYNLLKQSYDVVGMKALVIWVGESDAENENYSLDHEQNVKDIILGLRAFTGWNFKAIIIRINYPGAAYRDNVRGGEDNLALTVPNCIVIDSDSKALQDYVHVGELGIIELGLVVTNILNSF